jgi:hypothetical protein
VAVEGKKEKNRKSVKEEEAMNQWLDVIVAIIK